MIYYLYYYYYHEFSASKSAPIVTPEYSKTIEDMIVERIKASNFSNITPQKVFEKVAKSKNLSFLHFIILLFHYYYLLTFLIF